MRVMAFPLPGLVVTRTRPGSAGSQGCSELALEPRVECCSSRRSDREALHGGVGLVEGAGYLGVRDLGSGHDETLLVKTWMGTSRGCESVGVVIRSLSCPSAATGIRGRRGVLRGDSRSVGCGLVLNVRDCSSLTDAYLLADAHVLMVPVKPGDLHIEEHGIVDFV